MVMYESALDMIEDFALEEDGKTEESRLKLEAFDIMRRLWWRGMVEKPPLDVPAIMALFR